MKSFPFVFRDRELHLKKLDQDAKEDLLDRVCAGRLKQVERMHKKGYLAPGEYLQAKQAAIVKWGTEAFVIELADDANAAAFVRALLVEPADDATVAALVAEQRNDKSDLAAAILRMWEDDNPKATAPPASASTPTGGAPCSSTSPFGSPPSRSAA